VTAPSPCFIRGGRRRAPLELFTNDIRTFREPAPWLPGYAAHSQTVCEQAGELRSGRSYDVRITGNEASKRIPPAFSENGLTATAGRP
jgi:hypothetical protein